MKYPGLTYPDSKRGTIFIEPTQPASNVIEAGDWWFDAANSKMYFCDGAGPSLVELNSSGVTPTYPISPAHGGTGADTSALTGLPFLKSGAWNFSANVINVAACATGGSGTIGSPWTGWVSVLNALGDNVTAYFPAGYYSVSVKLVLGSGWSIYGDGFASIIVVGVLADDVIYASGDDNITIRMLKVDASGQTGADSHGIRIIDGENVVIDSVWVRGAAWDGIRLGPSGDNTGTVIAARITRCLLESNTYMGIGATDYKQLVIASNIIRSNGQNGIDLEPTHSTAPENNNNVNTVVQGNIITLNSGSGIILFNFTTTDDSKSRHTIVGNVITQNAGGYAVAVKRFLDVTVAANNIQASIAGIYMYDGACYLSVVGNTITNCTNAILMDGAATKYILATGNTFRDNGYILKVENGATVYAVLCNQAYNNNYLTNVELNTGQFQDNVGYLTAKNGTATIVNGTTSITVNHGLVATPTSVFVTPSGTWGNMTKFYVDGITSTQFTINADQDPGGNVPFYWRAVIE